VARLEESFPVLDPQDRASDERELAFISQEQTLPERQPVWERATRNTLYFGPDDPPDPIDPEEVFKPEFMSPEKIDEEPRGPEDLVGLDTSSDLYKTSMEEFKAQAERYSDVLNANRDMSLG
jgi:hypothetical protein